MRHDFKGKKLLLLHDPNYKNTVLIGALKVLGIQDVDNAYGPEDALRQFKEKEHDVILAPLINGTQDAIPLARAVRGDDDSPNKLTPIIAIGGQQTLHLLEDAQKSGVSDLLMAPYAVNDVAERISYCTSLHHEQIMDQAPANDVPTEAKEIEELQEEWPEEEDALSLTGMLLDHYIHHHEIVFMKLKMAQTATKRCISEVRSVSERIKERDNTNVDDFKDFDKMWEEIVQIFIEGGLAEEDLFKIENLVTAIPKDIKEHYEDLSVQDKSFLSLIEGLNSTAYKKAKDKVTKLQAKPNPLNGMTADDYKKETDKKPVKKRKSLDSFILNPGSWGKSKK